ncbi:efflux RND transporter periplasmic adaptor subunit [Caballeronia sp. LjRoot31]
MDTKTKLENAEVRNGSRSSTRGRAPKKSVLVIALAVVVIGVGWFVHSRGSNAAAASASPPLAQVTVSKPIVHDLDTRIGFLGQFSAVDQVELRAQVGGTLTGIYFKDGDVVHKGDPLFSIDPVPYEIKLAQAKAQLETASARVDLANHEFSRAQELQRNDAGTVENVEQKTSERLAAQAAVDNAKAQIRDAEFDLAHCRVAAPFTGRIGNHLVSVGNLVAGSRAATSPTTLLATLVSLDPIHLDFDMSEADFQLFSKYQQLSKGTSADKVQFALGTEPTFERQGVLDFINNVLDRSSGTIHARATVPNRDLALTPGEFARVRVIVAQATPTLLVPDASVLPDQSQHAVFTVSADGVVTPKRVEIGDIRGGLRVIRSGLNSDDRVIVGGLPFATPGAKVAPQDGKISYAAGQE